MNQSTKFIYISRIPWPKKKHVKRRLLNVKFAEIIARKLKNSGEIKCATDNDDYAEQIVSALGKQKCLKNMKRWIW